MWQAERKERRKKRKIEEARNEWDADTRVSTWKKKDRNNKTKQKMKKKLLFVQMWRDKNVRLASLKELCYKTTENQSR